MKKINIKQYINIAILLSAAALAGACGGEGSDQAGTGTGQPEVTVTRIRIGVCPGPYGKMIEEGIAPILKRQNIKTEVIEFQDYVQPNMALVSGDIEANVFQHKVFLQNIVDTTGMAITDVAVIPTSIGMAAFSEKYTNLDQLKEGDKLLIPSDAVNTGRALRLARDAGLVTLKNQEGSNDFKASLADIDENRYGVEFVPVDAPQVSRSLDSVAVGFIPGNFVIAAGLDFEDALAIESPVEDLMGRVVVRAADLDTIGRILKTAYESEEFKNYIDSSDIYKTFSRPSWWNK